MRKKRSLPPILAARSVVRKTKIADNLTSKEKEVVAKALVGELPANNPSIRESPIVQEAIIEALGELGVDSKFLAKHATEGLAATKLFGAESAEHPDWSSRHKYFTSIIGMATGKLEDRPGNLSVHYHYKSNLGKEPKVIDVTSPKNAKAQRRLIAARPTNRRSA